jgi:AsmA protein
MKKILIAVVAIVVLIVAALIVVPFLVPVETYQAQLIERVKAATGRDLKIGGKVSFSLFPVLGLEANQVSFSNAPGASTPDMVTLAKLEVALKAFPLLSGELAIDRFVLNQPVIVLEVDKQGRPNWQFAVAQPGTPAAATAAKPAEARRGAPLSELRLDDIRTVNGKVTYLDQRTGQKQELSDVNMKVSLKSLDDPFISDGSFVWRGKTVKTTITLAKPRAILDGGASDASAKVASDALNFDYKGKFTNSTPPKLEGPIDLKVPSVKGLAAWSGTELKAQDNTFGPMEVKGNLATAGAKIGFTDAQLAFDAIRGKGAFAFDGTGAKPKLEGKLDIDKLDVNPYLGPESKPGPAASGGGAPAPASAPGGQAAAPKASTGWSDDPIDFTALRAADADLALGVGSMQVRKIQIGQSALGIHLKDGRMTADLSKLALYQGAGSGKLMLDGSGQVPGVEAGFKLAGLQAEPALKDAMNFDSVTGTGQFDVAVTSRGKSQRELVGALNGKGDVRFANGVIKGIDLAAIARAVKTLTSGDLTAMAKGVEGALTGATGPAQKTDFSSFTGTFTITNGQLRNTDLDIKSPVLHATGAGTADLPKRTADYKVTTSLDVVKVGLIVQGPWDNLSYKPDLSDAMTQGAGKALQDLGKGLLQGNQPGGAAGSKPGQIPGADTLKGLFGGGRR